MFKSLKNKMNKALCDNSGTSLLELIIAVTILAIVTAPLLNVFIVSAKLSFKAKTMGLETNAITSIYEKIKGTDASEIVSANSDGSVDPSQRKNIESLFQVGPGDATIVPKIEPTSDGLYKQECRRVDIDLTGVASGEKSKDRKFDAKVSMSAIPSGSDDLIDVSKYDNDYIKTDNDTPRAVQMSFNNVWMQPTDGTDPDEIIKRNLPYKLDSDANELGETITKEADSKGQRVLKNQREIKISLETTSSSDGTIKVTPVIQYKYHVEWYQYDNISKTLEKKKIYSNGDSETKPTDSEETAVYKRKLSQFIYKETGKPETEHHFFDVMVFYKPYYDAVYTDSGYHDTVTIENESNLEGDFFLVKEEPDDSKSYSGIIRLMENHQSDPKNFKLKVHTNMGLAKTDDMLDRKIPLSTGTFRLVRIYNSAGYYNLSDDLRNTDRNFSVTSLIKEEPIDHIYLVTIKLYKAGELKSGDPVCTFSGIKVN